MTNITFSIVIITRNRGSRIRPTLDSILTIPIESSVYEVIIVDNGGNDNTQDIVNDVLRKSSINWKIITEEIKGICRARNAGYQDATGEWIVYLDDDALVHGGWLNAYSEAITQYPNAVVFGGPAVLDESLRRPWWWCDKFDWTMSCQDYGKDMGPYPEGGHPYGLNMMIRSDVLKNAGGFNPRLDDEISSFADETELFIRLMKEGNQLIYVPNARVIHSIEQNRLAWDAYMARRELVGRSHAYLDYHHGTDFRHPLLKHLRIAVEDFCSYLTPAVFVQELREWRGYRKYMSEISDTLT